MKNTIITLLSLICLFLIANTLGVFDFMSLSNHDETVVYRQKREKAVNHAETYKIVYIYNENYLTTLKILQGLEQAFEQINQTAEKKFELITVPNIKTMTEYNQVLQKYNDDFSVAAIIGPNNSGYIASSRALTSMYAMPLLSSNTFRSEHLTPLTFDTFQQMYPTLEEWIEVIGNHIVHQKDFKKLLIISPEKGTYGDFFATAMERHGATKMNLERIYRANYSEPLKSSELRDSMRFISSEKDVDCILYTGELSDFEAFRILVEQYFPNAVIYGLDSLYSDIILNSNLKNKLYLPKLTIHTANIQQNAENIKQDYKRLTAQELAFSIDRTLKKIGKYKVEAFMEFFKKEVKDFNAKNEISLFLVNPD